MRSMRSLAHISNWSQLKINQANAQGSVKTESSKDQPKEMLKAEMEDKRKDKSKCKRAKPDTLAIWVVSGSDFEAVALSSSLETRNSLTYIMVVYNFKRECGQTQKLGEPKRSLLGLGISWPSTLRSRPSAQTSC
jgi:hypothetical protein